MGAWLELKGGAPDEPSSLEELGAPGPWQLLKRLFQEACRVDIDRVVESRREEIPGEEERAEGRFGTPDIGCRLRKSTPLESSDLPVSCRCETYGLPGMELVWEYGLDQVNVAG